MSFHFEFSLGILIPSRNYGLQIWSNKLGEKVLGVGGRADHLEVGGKIAHCDNRFTLPSRLPLR